MIDEYIMDFLNLKLEVQISDGFAQHILLQNMSHMLLEKTILKYGDPTSFDAFVGHLRT